LDELEDSIRWRHPEIRIQKSETDQGAFDIRKVLQYARLLMPVSVSKNESASEQLCPYENPEQCLTEFSQWWEEKDRNPPPSLRAARTLRYRSGAPAEGASRGARPGRGTEKRL
jgi:hypothetical protein